MKGAYLIDNKNKELCVFKMGKKILLIWAYMIPLHEEIGWHERR